MSRLILPRRRLLLAAPAILMLPRGDAQAQVGQLPLIGVGGGGGGSPITIDGTPQLASTGPANVIVITNISTSLSNSILILMSGNYMATTNNNITSVSGGGLTWVRRVSGFGTSNNVEIWWALAASPIAGITVTANFNATYASIVASVSAYSGVGNTSAPFDTNGSLPAIQTTVGASALVSTSKNNAAILGNVVYNSTASAQSGFTQIVGFANYMDEYKLVTAAQTNLAVNSGGGAGDTYLVIGDALAGST